MKKMKSVVVLALLVAAIPFAFAGGEQGKGVASDKITLRIVDWSDSNKIQRDEFHKKFMERHPNVIIEYTMVTVDQFRNTSLTAIKSGNAPDLFPVPANMKLAVPVSENWFAALEDYLTKDFLNTIDPNYLLEGYQKINGKLYVLPENVGLASPFMYYNKDILAESGVDPAKIITYADFRDACKKITARGAGKYFGMIEGGNQLNRWETTARGWGGMAGGFAGRINEAVLRNGRSIYDTPEMIAVVELFRDLAKDGSFHPDTVSISAPEARSMFAQGQAGFLAQGIWCVATWERANPDFHFGVLPMPVPAVGTKGSVARELSGPWLGISATSKNKEMAGQYLMELYGEEYQGSCVKGGGFISVVKGINEKYLPAGGTKAYFDVAEKQMRTAPDPLSFEPKVADFYVQVKDIQPSLSAIMQGAVAGSIAEPAKALKELSDKATAEWTRAANAVGIPVSDFEFRNWDMTKDYTTDMYKGGR
jgi:ABC-type glycerol-3-phosphate transport system substrate-binding protein